MTDATAFAVDTREKKSPRSLRSEGSIPGNVFGAGKESQAVQFSGRSFSKLYEEAGDTGLITLSVSGKKTPVIIDEVQLDPMSGEALHVSFRRVNLKEKMTADIPLEIVGESNIPQSVAVLTRDSLEVEALPGDFPEVFKLDISTIAEVGQGILPAALDYDRARVTLMLNEEELEQPLVILQEVKEEVEESPEESEAATEGAEGDAGAKTDAEATENDAAQKSE